jgi:hypothetical protein
MPETYRVIETAPGWRRTLYRGTFDYCADKCADLFDDARANGAQPRWINSTRWEIPGECTIEVQANR